MFRRMTISLATVFAACLAFAMPAAAEPDGIWLRDTGSSRIRVKACGNGALCGTITWLKNPRKDVNNPDAAKRKKPLLGTTIFFGMKPTRTANKWKGQAYNPEDGKTYTGYMTLEGQNTLETEGCVLGGLICKSVSWKRVR